MKTLLIFRLQVYNSILVLLGQQWGKKKNVVGTHLSTMIYSVTWFVMWSGTGELKGMSRNGIRNKINRKTPSSRRQGPADEFNTHVLFASSCYQQDEEVVSIGHAWELVYTARLTQQKNGKFTQQKKIWKSRWLTRSMWTEKKKFRARIVKTMKHYLRNVYWPPEHCGLSRLWDWWNHFLMKNNWKE